MINSIKRHRYSNRNICKHTIMETLSLITCPLHFICCICHRREGSAIAWCRRERESEIEWEKRRYPWGGRQFSYSDWLIAQSCHEQEGTRHQESEEKWLELWVRRKKGQLLFISIERTTYVVWENRFGEESPLWGKRRAFFPPPVCSQVVQLDERSVPSLLKLWDKWVVTQQWNKKKW